MSRNHRPLGLWPRSAGQRYGPFESLLKSALFVAVVSGRACSIEAAAQEVHCASATALKYLRILRDEGMVGWDDGIPHSLHPTCEVVALEKPTGGGLVAVRRAQ